MLGYIRQIFGFHLSKVEEKLIHFKFKLKLFKAHFCLFFCKAEYVQNSSCEHYMNDKVDSLCLHNITQWQISKMLHACLSKIAIAIAAK